MNIGPLSKVLLPLFAATLLFGVACGGGGEQPPAPEPEATAAPQPDTTPAPTVEPVVEEPGDTPVIATEQAAHSAVGRQVRVEGTARNAKLSGVVVAEGFHLYCLDRADGWSEALAGKRVAATGTIEFTEEFAATSEGGAVSAGTDGGVFVVRNCTVQELPE